MSLLAEFLLMATDWWSNGVQCGIAVIAVIAACFAVYQLREIKQQTRINTNTNRSESYGQVTHQMSALTDILLDEPTWYPYFYGGIDPGDAEEKARRKKRLPAETSFKDEEDDLEARLQLTCEAIADFADALVEQRHSMPEAEDTMDWSGWDAYLRWLYQHSPYLRRFLAENTDFYPDYLTSVFGHLAIRDELSGEVDGQWWVREHGLERASGVPKRPPAKWLKQRFDPAVVGWAGYPWFRTWLFSKLPDDGNGKGEAGPAPTLVAVAKPATPSVAEVRLAWHGALPENDREIEERACSWVLEQLRSSSLLRSANVWYGDGDDWRGPVPTGLVRPMPRGRVRSALGRRLGSIWDVLNGHGVRLGGRPGPPRRELYLAQKIPAPRPRRG